MKDTELNNLCIIKDKHNDAYNVTYTTIDKFNSNYHKYVSDIDNKYFIIPVSNIENLFFILDRESMPKIFEKISISYTIQIAKQSQDSAPSIMYKQEIHTELDTPHSLFTFLYNLQELTIFNVLFNKHNGGYTFVYNITRYCINNGSSKSIVGINDLIDDIMDLYHINTSNDRKMLQIIIHGNGKCIVIKDESTTILRNSIYPDIKDNSKDAVYTARLGFANNTTDLQLYTFVSKLNMQAMIEIDTDSYLSGIYELGYGYGYDVDDWHEIDGSFTSIKSSQYVILDPMDYLVLLKLVPGMLRIIYNLLSLPAPIPLFDDMVPYFTYNFRLKPRLITRRRDCHTNDEVIAGHYIRDFIIKKEDDIYNADPYVDFIYDIMDYELPF